MANNEDMVDAIEGAFDDTWSKNNKKLSVERIYQKKTQLEHILLRPDTYIGSVEPVTQDMWVYDDDIGMINRKVTFVPGLYKIFDEILVNAADNKQRDNDMNCLKVEINAQENKIAVWNNGKGIPVVEHKDEKMFVPTLIFGHLLTSSNYNDEEKKVTGGRNGYGAKLCNIFSTQFIVETSSKQFNKSFKQMWSDNMAKTSEPKLLSAKGEDFTCITFHPDLSKFNMDSLDKDIVALMTRRVYDIAGCSRGVKVFLNGNKLPLKGFKDYVELYTKGKEDENNEPLQVIHEVINERWEVVVTLSVNGFQQISFVNSIATMKGGSHVNYITDQLASKIAEVVKKKNKTGKEIKSHAIKNYLWVFVNCLIENPTFDSQTKENMTLQAKNFGSKCLLPEKFIALTLKCGIVDALVSWAQFKSQNELNKKCSGKKHAKLKDLPKLEDANDAGTKSSIDCTLILTEGDSAKSLAVSGLGVVGRDKYGVFPLKGKMLNVREATHKQILENTEVNNIIKILGLQYKKKYETSEDLKTLRYGRLMIMTDQDQDGSHIKGLLINFIHHNWPGLLRLPFLEEFITPIVKARKGREEKSFFSLPEFLEWKNETESWTTWKVKYYKGLGTSTSNEAKEYFSDMNRHRIKFQYSGTEDDQAIELAFSKKMVEMRKEWLTHGMEERKRRRELGLPEIYLYEKNTTHVTYNDFVNKELILFSNMDNERSIPSLIDGLKPSHRKVLFTCLKKNYKDEIKVAQLAGAVSLTSAYHHGEMSLTSTIVNLAQNFVGSNNINLLLPIGQFGTRLQGGKDSASARYIFTKLSVLSRHLFSVLDEPLLTFLYDDNRRIEPEFYVPIIPMVLVNGGEGIGTGWSTKVQNYNHRELIENIRRMLDGEEPLNMLPWYKNHKGVMKEISSNCYLSCGEIHVNREEYMIQITELPIKVWTQNYKENVLEPLLHGSDKIPSFIQDYKEYHTDTTVRFVITLSPEKFKEAESLGFFKVFKLQTTVSTTSMVLFDKNGCLCKYDSVIDIFKEYFTVRSNLYESRRSYLLGLLGAEALKLSNQARFILEKIDGKIVIENRKKVDMIQTLQERGYDSDPIVAWKEMQKLDELNNEDTDEDTEATQSPSSGADYDYLLGMKLWSLTLEKKEELLKNCEDKKQELKVLEKKTPHDLWRADLDAFVDELDKLEAKEKEEEGQAHLKMKGNKGRKKPAKRIEDFSSLSWDKLAPDVETEIMKRQETELVAAKQKKLRKIKEQIKDNEDEPLQPLAKRIKLPKVVGKNALMQTKIDFAGKRKLESGNKPNKKLKKNVPFDPEKEDILDISENDHEERTPSNIQKVAKGPQKEKYNFDHSDSNSGDDPYHISESTNKKKIKKPRVAKKTNSKNVPNTTSKQPAQISVDTEASNKDEPTLKPTTSHQIEKSQVSFAPKNTNGNIAAEKSPVLHIESSDEEDFILTTKKAFNSKKETLKNVKGERKGKKNTTKSTKKPRNKFDSSESFSDDQVASIKSPVKPRTAGGRARAAVQYNFQSSDED